MADRLLAEVGRTIFPNGPAKAVLQPSETIDKQSPEPQAISAVFQVDTGTLIIGSLRASFVDRRNTTTSVSETCAGLFKTPAQHFNAITVDQVIKRLAAANPTLTPAQLSTIADKVAHASAGNATEPQVKPIRLTDSGLLEIGIQQDHYIVLADGRSINTQYAPLGLDTAGRPIPTPGSFRPDWPGSPNLMAAQVVHCGANLLVALMLMFGSYRLLADQPTGAQLIYKWAVLKFILIVCEVVLVGVYVNTIDESIQTNTHFDVGRGIGGLVLSVFLQISFALTLFLSMKAPATVDYLASRGMSLRLASARRWHAAMTWVRRSRLSVVFKFIGAALLGLAVLHGVSSAYTGIARDLSGAIMHAVLAIAAMMTGLYFLRLKRLGAAIMLAACLVAMNSTPCLAQTLPTTEPALSAEDQAARDDAVRLIAAIDPKDAKLRSQTIAEVARLGQPAVQPLLDYLITSDPNSNLGLEAGRVWNQTKLSATPEFRRTMVAFLYRLPPRRFRNLWFRFSQMIGSAPEMVPFWTDQCFSENEDYSNQAIVFARRNDPQGNREIARATDILHTSQLPKEHARAWSVLQRWEAPGRAAVFEFLGDPSTDLRIEAVSALGTPRQADPKVLDALVEFVIDPTKGLDNPPNADVEDKMRRAALTQIEFLQHHSPRLIQLLNSDRMPETAKRNMVLNVFVNKTSPLTALEKPDRPKEEWASLQRVLTATLGDWRTASDRVARLLKSENPTDRNLAIIFIGEGNRFDNLSIDEILPRVDTTDPRVCKALQNFIDRKKESSKSPAVIQFLASQMKHGDDSAKHSAAQMLGNGSTTERLALADSIGAEGQQKQLAQRNFVYVSRNSRLAHSLIEPLFQRYPWNELVASVARDVSHFANLENSSYQGGVAQVLKEGTPSQKAVLADVVLSHAAAYIGPASRARAKAIMKEEPPSIDAVTAVADTRPAITLMSSDGMSWTSFTWFATTTVLIVAAGLLSVCMVIGFFKQPAGEATLDGSIY